MANTKKTGAKTSTTTKKTNSKTQTKVRDDTKPVVKEIADEEKVATQTPIKARQAKPDIPLNTMVDVVNGFHGRLVYISKKTGEEIIWDGFGDVQSVELQELKYARASQKKFFTANWWLIDDPDVIKFLNAAEFYKYAVNAEDYDEIFKKPIDELTEIVSELTDGQKKSMAYRAVELINSGELDSRKTIDALRDALGFELIDE